MRFAGEKLGGGYAALGAQAGPDFGGMSRNTVELRGKEKEAVHAAESQVNQYGLKSIADIRSAEEEAEALRVQGQQAGQAAMFGGLMDGISGIAGAGIQKWGGSMFGNTGNTTYTGTNGVGQYSLTAPLSTGKNASSKLDSFLSGAHMKR